MQKVDVDLLKPSTVPISPDTVLWFEFLIEHDLLENHLKKPNPDPSPTELITKFLTISLESAPPQPMEVELIDGEKPGPDAFNAAPKLSRRQLALKILAVKTFAFLKWDLDVIETKIPLPLQGTLLRDLLILTNVKCNTNFPTSDTFANLNFEELSDEQIFGIALHHRWTVHAIMNSALVAKQARLNNPLHTNEELMSRMDGEGARSESVLMQLINCTKKPVLKMPTFDCFIPLTDGSEYRQDWSRGIDIDSREFLCQILYDLGTHQVYRQAYPGAKESFNQCVALYNELGPSKLHYCSIPLSNLRGYCQALNIPFMEAETEASLIMRFYTALLHDDFNEIINILQEDNTLREIPLNIRLNLEQDWNAGVSCGSMTATRELLIQIQTLNVVRQVLEDSPQYVTQDFISKIHNIRRGTEILVWVLKPIMANATDLVKRQVIEFLIKVIGLPAMLNFPVSQLVTKSDLEEYENDEGDDLKDIGPIFSEFQSVQNIQNPLLEVSFIEQKLVSSYDVEEIKDLIYNNKQVFSKKPIWAINNEWELAIPLQSFVAGLSAGHHQIHSPFQQFVYVLLAKAKQLNDQQNFSTALAFLHAIEKEIGREQKNSPAYYKQCQLIAWECLLVDLNQLFAEWPAPLIDQNNLVQQCTQCLSTRQAGNEPVLLPRLEIMEMSAVALLNLGEWEFLTSPMEKRFPFFEVVSALAVACNQIKKFKGNKKVSRDAWEMILPVFHVNGGKRNMGNGVNRPMLMHLLTRLRDPSVISLVAALLARLHTALRDDAGVELITQYSVLWPASVSNANAYSCRLVDEVLVQLLQSGLRHYPNNEVWLKLLGDVNFSNGHHAAALKCYLQSIISVSDFFSRPLTRTLVEDAVFKRMIKACMSLQCYTQAAVLCQFLEEVDYATAFKCLSENNCSDAMDSYYNYIWDNNILEFLINLHTKHNQYNRKKQALQVIGLLELNTNNNEEIKREATNLRKSRFLHAMVKQYIC
nr:PREDICTED: integrator complex subunit 8 [Bemisia tabaci]